METELKGQFSKKKTTTFEKTAKWFLKCGILFRIRVDHWREIGWCELSHTLLICTSTMYEKQWGCVNVCAPSPRWQLQGRWTLWPRRGCVWCTPPFHWGQLASPLCTWDHLVDQSQSRKAHSTAAVSGQTVLLDPWVGHLEWETQTKQPEWHLSGRRWAAGKTVNQTDLQNSQERFPELLLCYFTPMHRLNRAPV